MPQSNQEQHLRCEAVSRFVNTAVSGDVPAFLRNLRDLNWPEEELLQCLSDVTILDRVPHGYSQLAVQEYYERLKRQRLQDELGTEEAA